jgi:biopolymer transport protein ExbD
MGIKSRSKRSIEFSMASMSDMVFLLLIFFMMSSTMIAPNAVKLLLPQSNSQVQAKAVTTVSITGNIQYYIETTPVNFEQLELLLQAKLRGVSEPIIALHADKSVPVEHVVKVMNIAQRNKFKLILATTAEK